MNLKEMINPWQALRRAKLEIEVLKREQAILVEELRKAQKNDQRGPDGRFKKA